MIPYWPIWLLFNQYEQSNLYLHIAHRLDLGHILDEILHLFNLKNIKFIINLQKYVFRCHNAEYKAFKL